MHATNACGRVVLVPWVLLLCSLPSNCLAIETGNDPAGDTFGEAATEHDITNVEVVVTESSANIFVDFLETLSPPSDFATDSVVGYVDIDIDQDANTGTIAKKNEFSPRDVIDLGAEYHIDLFSERFHPGEVELIDTQTFQPVGRADISYGSHSLEIQLPLDLINNDTLFNYGVIVGDFLDMSDEAPNDGFGTTIPEPSAVVLLGIALLRFGCRTRPSRKSQTKETNSQQV